MYIDDCITRGFVNFDEVNFGDEKSFDEFRKRSFLITFDTFDTGV